MDNKLNLCLNPFVKIAGGKALLWGVLGIVVATATSWYSGFHYHGLLHFGPAPNDAWWCYVVEHLVVWLVPALLFFIGGLLLSTSRIRIVDVFGTVAFAQLPFILMNLFTLLPPMQRLNTLDFDLPPSQLLNQPGLLVTLWFSLISIVFLVWILVWMYNALKVSCNLKGTKLGVLYTIVIIGSDALCRILIRLCY
ncbi:YIP1 family protein [Parabacteroides sp. PFB2-10]|uniref:YIP1 family protein n=1 Tax=Parabacteroides sp. PFB2-10 TaxID=1742405 RepID=UPI002474D005|nr:YIP1 family protein [Parabacteroides sp. PFB2-10]